MQAVSAAGVFAALLLGLPIGEAAGGDWPPIAREELQMEPDPLGSQPAVILFEQGGADDRGSVRRQTLHRRIKILTAEGIDWRDLRIVLADPAQRLESLEARSVKPNGREAELTNMESLDRRSNADGMTEIRVRIPDVSAGDIIEYRYEIVGGAVPPLSGWVFQHDIPCLVSRFEWRPGLALTSHWTLVGAETWDPLVLPLVPEGSDSLDAVRFEIRNLPGRPAEPFGPPVVETRPRLVTTYTTIAAAPQDYWDVFAAEAAAREERFSAGSDLLRDALASVGGLPDDFEGRIRRAYVLASSHLAPGIASGTDGPPLGGSATADSVLAAGVTNHEGVHLLFVAALRAQGIEAHRAFVVDRDRAFFHHELQSPAQFSRTVVAVSPDTSRAFFFSPGTPFAPPGALPWYVQGITALVADPRGARFTRTPMDEAGVNTVMRSAKLSLTPDGGIDGNVRIDYAGQAEIAARTTLSAGDDALKSALNDSFRRTIPGLAITGFSPINRDNMDRNLSVEMDVSAARIGQRADERLLVNPGAMTRGEDRWPPPGNRREPVFFPYARSETDNVTLGIPREWRIDSVPDLVDFQNSAGRYRSIWSFDGTSLVHQRVLVLNRAHVPVGDFGTLRELLDVVEAGDATLVPLVRVPLRPSERGR